MGHHPKCLAVTRNGHRATPPGWRTFGKDARDSWIRALRPVRLTPYERAVALTLASYANKGDGKNARPGNDRLAWASGTAVITVRRALDKLHGLWLIHCVECGNGRGHATVWWLTFRDDMDDLGVPFDSWRELNT